MASTHTSEIAPPIYGLNNDVLDLIFADLSTTNSLSSASRACSLFYRYSIPLLYRNVVLRRGADNDAATAYILRRLTAPGSHLPSFIRELRFQGWGLATTGHFMAMPYRDELCSLVCILMSKTYKRHLRDIYWDDYPSLDIFSAIQQYHPEARLHIKAARVADAWERMWPALGQCYNQITSLTLKRLSGSHVSAREVIKLCPNLENLLISCPDPDGRPHPPMHVPVPAQKLLRFSEHDVVPRPKSLTLHNWPLYEIELANWAEAGGFDRLTHLDTGFPYMDVFGTAAHQTLRSLTISDPIALLPPALPHVLGFLSQLERCQSVFLACTFHSAPLLHLAATAPYLTSLHLHAPEPFRANVIRTVDTTAPHPALVLRALATDFPALRHFGLDLNWIPVRLFNHTPGPPPGVPDPAAPIAWDLLELVARIPRLEAVTLYGQSTQRLRGAARTDGGGGGGGGLVADGAGATEPWLTAAMCRYIFEYMRGCSAGTPLRELVVHRGTRDLDFGRGMSLDQSQAVWERNEQMVFRCFVERSGTPGAEEGEVVRVEERGFERVWGKCDTKPNNVGRQGWMAGEVEGVEPRSLYDRMCGRVGE